MLIIIIRVISLVCVIYLLVKLLVDNAVLSNKNSALHLRLADARRTPNRGIRHFQVAGLHCLSYGEELYVLMDQKVYRIMQSGHSHAWELVHDFAVKRDLTPCFYCKRYDATVENFSDKIRNDGLTGHYHSHCAAEVIRSATAELVRRMS